MRLWEAYTESLKTNQESGGANYRGRTIYRKATGLVVEFDSAQSPRKNADFPFPTLEDMGADDWFPVVIGTAQNAIMN